MTEIKLTKRYPQSRTEDIVDAYMRGWNDALDAVQNGKFIINDDRKTEPTISKMEQVEDEPQTDCAWRQAMTWKPIEGATNAPKGMRWWNNGESRFGGNYRHELRPESQPISEGTDETQADERHQNGLDSMRDRGMGQDGISERTEGIDK